MKRNNNSAIFGQGLHRPTRVSSSRTCVPRELKRQDQELNRKRLCQWSTSFVSLATFVIALSSVPTTHATRDTLFAVTNTHLVDARLDPIVNEGTCSGHVHSVMGNANFQAVVTDRHLTDDNWRNSNGKEDQTTSNVIPNLSLYWAPSMYVRSPDDNMYYIVPSWARAYYRIQYKNPRDWREIHPLPKNLRLVMGNARQMTNVRPGQKGRDNIKWTRKMDNRSTTDKMNHGDWQYLKDDYANGILPPPELEMKTKFPSCLRVKANGEPRLDSSDHRSHAKYQNDNDRCPNSHPYHIPMLDLEIRYTLAKLITNLVHEYGYSENRASQIVNNPENWILSTGDQSGASGHVDFISGWPEDLFEDILENCRKDGDADRPSVPITRIGGTGPCPIIEFFSESRDEQARKTVPFDNPVPQEEVRRVAALPGLEGSNSVCILEGHITPAPTPSPTLRPTSHPTLTPTFSPTSDPTSTPTSDPTPQPTPRPTQMPTTPDPTPRPTSQPTESPTLQPTAPPTLHPTSRPTAPTVSSATPVPTTPAQADSGSQTTPSPMAVFTINDSVAGEEMAIDNLEMNQVVSSRGHQPPLAFAFLGFVLVPMTLWFLVR